MDSRTKFYGPVLAMLSLSAVAFNGFITPPLELEESTESQDRQEEARPAPDDSDVNNPEADSSDTDDLETATSQDDTRDNDPNSSESPPEPVTLLDFLFIPISDDSTQP